MDSAVLDKAVQCVVTAQDQFSGDHEQEEPTDLAAVPEVTPQQKQHPWIMALRSVRTSNQWSLLSSVLAKVNAKLPAKDRMDCCALGNFLKEVGEEELNSNGIWFHSFGDKYIPLVLTNPAFREARLEESSTGAEPVCVCPIGTDSQSRAVGRFHGSTDYNAGRHCSTASQHRATCYKWRPPSTGHLHSWRRGYD